MPVSIAAKQNEPTEIKKLRAQRCLHGRAKRIVGAEVLLTTVLPVAGAMAVTLWPKLKGSLAFYSLLISLIDLAILEPLQKSIQTKAAKVQETFDCSVLDLPWSDLRVGARPEEEDIHSASCAYRRGRGDEGLKNWYPAAAGEVPLSLGRIICQRANLRWDTDLRRRYRTWLASILLIVGIVIVSIGLQGGRTLEDLTISILAPISPVFLWGIREFRRQGEAADTSDRLRSQAMTLWGAAVGRTMSEEGLRDASRDLQSEIFTKRASAPIIFDWLYRLMRTSAEERMSVAAEELVQEARKHGF